MKIGLCADSSMAQTIKDIGFDYIELPLNKIGLYSDEEFSLIANDLGRIGLPVGAFSLLLPKTMKIIGNEYNKDYLEEYLDIAFSRMIELGADIVSFGSGKSRFVPEYMNYNEAFKSLVEVTKVIVEHANKFGVTIAIEPLNQSETNLINTLTEGAILSCLTGASLLVDAFHVRKEQESLTHIKLCAPFIHAHIATLDGRRYPIEKNTEVIEFIKALKDSGYKGNISIEGKTDDIWTDGPKALSVIRNCYLEA